MDSSSANASAAPRSVVILDGLRTPFAKAGSALTDVHAAELGRVPLEELLLRHGITPADVDAVIFGNVAQPADSANIARVIALRSGLSITTPAMTVHRNCASGMEAVTTAFDKIRFGNADLVVCGGVESMSGIPFLFKTKTRDKFVKLSRSKSMMARVGVFSSFRPSDFAPVIGIEQGLTDPVCGLNMGETAENLAREFAISRDDQDRFALRSHQRASAAIESNLLAEEIVPVYASPKYEAVADDVGPRKNQTLEALGKLRPYFDRALGTVTVGNACPITDGGVAMILATEEKARELGVEPIGRIRSYAYQGCPPDRMGLGPAFASPVALDRAGLAMKDIERVELNEAFAAQVLANCAAFESDEFARKELGRDSAIGVLEMDRLNVNGGAIAFGHPVGASGARIILTLLHELRRSRSKLGLATLCVGGGQGGAVVVEGM